MSVYGEAKVVFKSDGFDSLKQQLSTISELLGTLKTKTSSFATGFTNVADQLKAGADKLASSLRSLSDSKLANASKLEKEDASAGKKNRIAEQKEFNEALLQQVKIENQKLEAYARENAARRRDNNLRLELEKTAERGDRLLERGAQRTNDILTKESQQRIRTEQRTQAEIGNLMRTSQAKVAKEMDAFTQSRMKKTSQSDFIPGGDLAHQIRDMFTLAVAGFALATPMREAAYFEKLKVQFETLTGSMERSKKVYADLVMFAAETPFQFGEVADMSKKFELFGGATLNTSDNLRLVGDAAAASGRELELVSFWVARLYGMLKDGQAFGEQAIHLQKLGLLTGHTREKMEEMQKAGVQGEKIFDIYLQSLKRFSGGMEQMSRTSHGLWSILKDFFTLFLARIGQVVNDAFKPLLKSAGDMFQNFYKGLSESTVRVLATVGAFGAFALSIASVTTAISLLWKSLLVSHLLTPFIAVINMLKMAFFELGMAIKMVQTVGFAEALATWGTSLGLLTAKLTGVALAVQMVYDHWSMLQKIAKEGFGTGPELKKDQEVGDKQAAAMHKAVMDQLDLEKKPEGLKDRLARNKQIQDMQQAQQKLEDQATIEFERKRKMELAKAHLVLWKKDRTEDAFGNVDQNKLFMFERQIKEFDKIRAGQGGMMSWLTKLRPDFMQYDAYMKDIESNIGNEGNAQKTAEQVKFTYFREQTKIAFKEIGEMAGETLLEGLKSTLKMFQPVENLALKLFNENFPKWKEEFPDANWKGIEFDKKTMMPDIRKWMNENTLVMIEEKKKQNEKLQKEQEKADEEENERHFKAWEDAEKLKERRAENVIEARKAIIDEYLDQFKRQDEKRKNFQPQGSDSWGFFTHTLQQSLKGPDHMKTIAEITAEHKTLAQKTLDELKQQGIDTLKHQEKLEKEFAIIAIQ